MKSPGTKTYCLNPTSPGELDVHGRMPARKTLCPSGAVKNIDKGYRDLIISSQGRPQSQITNAKGKIRDLGAQGVGGLHDFKVRPENADWTSWKRWH